MMAKKIVLGLVSLTACLYASHSWANTSQSLQQSQITKFNQIYKSYGQTWLATYKSLLLKNISPGVGAKPLASANQMINDIILNFYQKINANKRPVLVKNRYTFPAFSDFEYVNNVCRIAMSNAKQMARLEKSNFVAKKFCEYTTFYHGLFVADFNRDKVHSLNARASRKFFNNQQWRNLQRGQYGFKFQLLQSRDLLATRVGKYVSK
ncbi:hypothetical protein [Psittacicella gerlachiana]|uniref:Uncharacterized protein n=1 Tax=Psittacicella gerlachiana TaxID=2028574 RepID=A0A3A1YLQ9_9GAMM|nr:hypothetical protein [Psittacicella gerlachiana]RIY38491.1 hypothetical protein CKF59_00710 [Psittacicella gerlachiana]